MSVQTYPEANLVRLMLDGGVRLQIRPSGTEPKVKLYGEAVDIDPAELQSLLESVTRGVRHHE
jgi:phosphomannomutase